MAKKAKAADAAQEPTTIYLIAPAAGGGAGPRRVVDPSVKNEGAVGDTVRAIFGERKEVAVDAVTVTNQISNYVTVINAVAEKQAAKESVMRLSEITLSLTLSASGNIGIASTSAEAGITLVFKRE